MQTSIQIYKNLKEDNKYHNQSINHNLIYHDTCKKRVSNTHLFKNSDFSDLTYS